MKNEKTNLGGEESDFLKTQNEFKDQEFDFSHSCYSLDDRLKTEKLGDELVKSKLETFDFLKKGIEIDRKKIFPKEVINDYPIDIEFLRITPGLPQWFSVFLFFNLDSTVTPPAGYMNVTGQDVLNMIDLGENPSNPTIQDFIYDYWNTLSYGNLRFSIDIAKNADLTPFIPNIIPPANDPQRVEDIAKLIIQANPQAVWEASGGLIRDGKRYIPSVVLVHRYWNHPSAALQWNFEFSVGELIYRVGEYHHLGYSNQLYDCGGGIITRDYWSTLCHEFGHNFTDEYDLYGAGGCTGYWDVLGCHLEPRKMSEISALYKAKIGWINYKEIISTNSLAVRTLELQPYTRTGEAFKIVPDPMNNPQEYFILEYRKSIGTEAYVPDGCLVNEGLLITHINERIWFGGKCAMLREAPFFDPEYADFSEFGEALWQGIVNLDYQNPLYPQPSNNSFTNTSSPNSNFYGARSSGLSITNIRLEDGLCRFEIAIAGGSRIGWQTSAEDRGLAGRFSTVDPTISGQEIMMRNNNNLALLIHKKGQVFVRSAQNDWIDSWNLGTDNRELVGDFDGDGLDEIYLRSPNWAGLLKYRDNRFNCDSIQHDWIDGWNLGEDNWEIVADIDGDGHDEIIVRSPTWIGVFKYVSNRFNLIFIKDVSLALWNFSILDKMYAGNFSRTTKEEMLIRNDNSIALFAWNTEISDFVLECIHENVIDTWTLHPNDQYHLADLDGDGLTEIYVRNDNRAAVFKYDTSRFTLLWSTENFIPHINNVMSERLSLNLADQSYVGRFFNTKQGILHRFNGEMALLIWENNRMNVRFGLTFWYAHPWGLNPSDKLILGDFHKVGIEGYSQIPGSRAVVPYDHVSNNVTDIFIHDTRGTAMSCLSYNGDDFRNPSWNGFEWALTWTERDKILFES